MPQTAESLQCACGSHRPYIGCCGYGDECNLEVEAPFREAVLLHQHGQVLEAMTGYRKVLQEAPDHPGALYLLGAAELEVGNVAAAIPLMVRAFSVQPKRDTDAHYTFALALQLSGDRTEAIRYYRKTLELNPGFSEARNNLAVVLRSTGRVDEATALLEEAQNHGHSSEQLLNLASLHAEQGRLTEAEAVYRKALVQQPDQFTALNNLGALLIQMKRIEEGLSLLDRARTLRDDSADLWYNLGRAYVALTREGEAVDAYRRATELDPNYFRAYAAWAALEERRHQLERAVELAERALAIDPEHPESLASKMILSKFHRRRKQPGESLAILDGIAHERLPPLARKGYFFQRGAVLDSLERYDEAFDAYRRANEDALSLDLRHYDRVENETKAKQLMEFFVSPRVQALSSLSPAPRVDLPQPIFIVGFPRSGTTMVEQILSAHPAISAGDELPYFTELVNRSAAALGSSMAYPACLTDLAREKNHYALDHFRNYYLSRARGAGIPAEGKRQFTDKMPLNEWHLGLVRLVFPQSPVIHVVRHPLDSCLSSYFVDMTHGNYGSYNLETVATHYVLSYRLAEHYRQHIGLTFLRVRYEDLVADIESGVRRLLDFVGVPFNESCVNFHESERVARTASYAQVNQKLYNTSLYRYRHYRRHIEPMLPILEPVISELGYTID